MKCVGVVLNSSQESLWKLQRRMSFIFVHWLLNTLVTAECWATIPSLLCQISAAEHSSWLVCLCILKLPDTQVFLQIHSSTEPFEVAFTAEQTLLFYFAFSVIINCKLDKMLIIILIAIRPCDWEKKWDSDKAKITVKCYGNLQNCCTEKFLHKKMYAFIVFLSGNILFVYAN